MLRQFFITCSMLCEIVSALANFDNLGLDQKYSAPLSAEMELDVCDQSSDIFAIEYQSVGNAIYKL